MAAVIDGDEPLEGGSTIRHVFSPFFNSRLPGGYKDLVLVFLCLRRLCRRFS